MTAIDVPTRYPVALFQYVGIISAQARTPIASTALYGMRLRLTDRQRRWPGRARSRENANIILDADVTDAVRQNIWAIQQMKSRISAHVLLIEVVQIYVTAPPTASSVPCVSGTANVTASSSTHPKATETTTDMYMPTAAIRDAWCVSSAMCADASKPVIVYCDISRPRPNTYQNTMLPQPVPEKPELLIVSVNT